MEFTKEQWELIAPIIKRYEKPKKISGRPRVSDEDIVKGILWVCRTGARWKDMPRQYPPYQTCHRRFQEWNKSGLWNDILVKLAIDLKRRGKMDVHESFIDGTFASAKKGALVLEKLSGAKAPRSWPLQTAMVYLSPFPHTRQARMKLSLLKKRYKAALLKPDQNES